MNAVCSSFEFCAAPCLLSTHYVGDAAMYTMFRITMSPSSCAVHATHRHQPTINESHPHVAKAWIKYEEKKNTRRPIWHTCRLQHRSRYYQKPVEAAETCRVCADDLKMHSQLHPVAQTFHVYRRSRLYISGSGMDSACRRRLYIG